MRVPSRSPASPMESGVTPVVHSSSGESRVSLVESTAWETLDRYKLVARLGQGGMAEVFLAAQEVESFVHRPVVIKRLYQHLSDDENLVQMFLDEARLLCVLQHPNIVRTFEAGVIDGRCCIAMEYLEGQTLQAVLRRAHEQGAMTPALAVEVAISVLKGLHYAHEAREDSGKSLEIVHRDVSPHNVFVTNKGQVKVLDFGIAKATTQLSHTRTGFIKGKVGYIAPEQAKGEVIDRRADVFSVGVLLWESLTGARLFKAESEAAALHLTLAGPISPPSTVNPAVPRELDDVVLRALARDPAERTPTAAALQRELERFLATTGWDHGPGALGVLMRNVFATEMIEQRRLVAVLMARSDCTPPSRPSEPGSTSALVVAASEQPTVRPPAMRGKTEDPARKRDARAVVGLGVFAFAIGWVLVSGLLSRGRGEPVRGPDAVAVTPAAAPPALAETVSLAPTARERPTAVAFAPAEAAAPPPGLVATDAPATAPSSVLSRPRGPALALATNEQRGPRPVATKAAPPAAERREPDPPTDTAAAPTFGALTLDSSPWALVSVQGKPLGQTPIVGAKLPAGTHVLTLVNPELGLKTTYAVTIEAGKTTSRRIGLE
ncbi:MAG TPA: serine/threonine-protein kinase [Polyangiaceae bacterium]|nr:serine/threonine-protein kinase [Polyangiaceae bacterium]